MVLRLSGSLNTLRGCCFCLVGSRRCYRRRRWLKSWLLHQHLLLDQALPIPFLRCFCDDPLFIVSKPTKEHLIK